MTKILRGGRVAIVVGEGAGKLGRVACIAFYRHSSPASREGGKRYKVALIDLDDGTLVTLPIAHLRALERAR